MSNLNIICKSDKCEFSNYFSEPLVFPKNAEISLVKGNLTVPVLAQQELKVPAIPAGGRTTTWLETTIDGIFKDYTWRDLYTAWAGITGGLEQTEGVTENEFFDGNFVFFLNNPYKEMSAAATNTQRKVSFQEALSDMIDAKYLFHKIRPSVRYERNETEIFNQRVSNVGGDQIQSTPVTSVNYGFTSVYDPGVVAIQGLQAGSTNVATVNNFGFGGGATTDITSAGHTGGVKSYDCLYYDFENTIDPNGGHYQFNKNTRVIGDGSNNCYVGVKFNLSAVSQGAVLTNAFADPPGLLDVGLEFALNTVRVYDQGTHYPQQFAIDTFTDTDNFFIAVQRDGLVGPSSNKFRVLIYKSATGVARSDASLIYESSFIGPSNAHVGIHFVVAADGDGHQVNNIEHIPMTNDSLSQSDMLQDDNGVSFQGQIAVNLSNEAFTYTEELTAIDRFFNVLGLNKYVEDELNQPVSIMGEQPSNNALMLKWTKDLQVLSKDCKYKIAPNNLLSDYDYNAGNCLVLNGGITNLPRQLEVRITNVNLKNFNGSEPNANNATGSFIEEGLNRIVGTIPTPQPNNVNKNIDWVMQYEPYTPVYRPLNNPNAFSVNQLNIEISYKDFQTNERKTINNIDGTLALEFHVRTRDRDAEISSHLRPY